MSGIAAMIAMQNPAAVLAEHRRLWRRSCLILCAGLAIVAGASYQVRLFDGARLAQGVPSFLSLASEMLPPNFAEARSWLWPVLDTLMMSIAGTALALLFSLPLSLLAAFNTTPHPLLHRSARVILNALRSVPELIMGILFVAAVGFGALPGVLALGLHSVGMVGKFFAESIEHAHHAPIEAALAAGHSPMQVIFHGVLPQVLPQMADVSIYRWEYNFRASTVMGMVGAGGIGFELMGALRLMQYRDLSALLIVVLLMVTIVDTLSGYLRKQFK
jgi:phosphonate transport system permease protein